MIADLIKKKVSPIFNIGDMVYIGEDGKVHSIKSKNRGYIGHIAEVMKRGKDDEGDDVIISLDPIIDYGVIEICDIISEEK